MSKVFVIMRRELAAYFTSPLAYVFITVFLAMAGGLTFSSVIFWSAAKPNSMPFSHGILGSISS